MEPFRDTTALEAMAQDIKNAFPDLIVALSSFNMKDSSPPTLIVEEPASKQNVSIEPGEDWRAKLGGMRK